MGIDINLLRKEKGGEPQTVLDSEKKRFRKPEQNYAEQTIELDEKWRKKRFELEQLSKEINVIQEKVGQAKKSGKPCEEELSSLENLKHKRDQLQVEEKDLNKNRDNTLKLIGNIVHESVLVSNDEEQNPIVRTWGTLPTTKVDSTLGQCAHHQVLAMIDGYDPKRGQKIAGHRGYFLKGWGALLNMALVNYGMHFLSKRGYTILHTPFFMKKSIMAETCQLADFDEQLYNVTTGKDEPDSDFYLIATSEQPISAYFYKESIEAKELPLRFCGYSSCFRKEAGAHGKDNLGIFRIHQFEKVEQFSITEPEDSWNEHERMIKISEEFYQSLKLPYRVVSIVSGALNDAAAKKYDLEAWFPSYNTFRELVSCSNCTDFQSRGLEVKCFGAKKDEVHDKKKQDHNEHHAKEADQKKTDEQDKKEKKEEKDKKDKKDENEVKDKKDKKKNEKEEKKTEKDEKGNRLVHMLNGTLCATERTLCCILENYQTKHGIIVPEVLRPYVGTDYIPYTKPIPKEEKKDEKDNKEHKDEKKPKKKDEKVSEKKQDKAPEKKEAKTPEKKEAKAPEKKEAKAPEKK